MDVLQFLLVYGNVSADAVLFVINWVFSALICMPYAVEASSRCFTDLTSSSSRPARPSMSSAKRKFVIVLSPILTVLHGLQVRQPLFSLRRCWRGWGRADILGALQLWFGTILQCRGILWFPSGCYWCCTASCLPTKLHAKLCRTPSWSPRRHGKGFAGVAGISHKYYKTEKNCSVVLLPALKLACSSLIISSACGFSLFRRILSMTLLGWLIRLMVR